MIIEQFNGLLSEIKGCTFASLDADTKERGVIRRVTGEQVMLFTNKNGSGYESLVRRRLLEVNKDPDSFVLGERRWGTRIPGTPLVTHHGFYYLDTILLREGRVEYFTLTGTRIPEDQLSAFVTVRKPNQDLPDEKKVIVRTYALENIRAIRLLGERLPKQKLSLFKGRD